ncbi:MAG TPA: hypothetical protein VKY33_07475 [Flavobacterium sp.]|nr:hypothetical protein [Flavobacterium sp.]
MKRCLIIVLMILISVEGFTQDSASTNLTIELQSIQSIKINEQQQNVALSLKTITDYMEGGENMQPDHVEVMSNIKYEVRVMAQSHLLSNQESIDISHLKIQPSEGTMGNSSEAIQFIPVQLSLNDNQLLKSQKGDLKRTVSMMYKLNSSDDLFDKPTGNYTTVITYTILSL